MIIVNISDDFTRPADTTSYTSGDLVANSTAAASVVAMTFDGAARSSGGAFLIRRARLFKTTTTTTAASFRLHLYTTDPSSLTGGIANGDNAAWSTDQAGYVGSIDLDVSGTNGRAFVDGSGVSGVPLPGPEIAVDLDTGEAIYGLLEARGSYAPGSAEVFTITLEIVQT